MQPDDAALAQFGHLYPELWSGVRDALAWFIGDARIAAVDADELAQLIAAAIEGRRGKQELSRWIRVLPAGTVDWPEFSSWAEERGAASHEAMIRCLVDTALSRSLAMFQAGRRRSGRVVPFAVYRADIARCSSACRNRNGLALSTEVAGPHWRFRLACRRPLCVCFVMFTDERGLGRLSDLGVPIHAEG